MLTFSAVLAPVRSLHAHVDADHHVHIHDGHLHDPVGHESHEIGHDVDLQVATSLNSVQSAGWTLWAIALPAVFFWTLAAPYLKTYFRPPIAIQLPAGRRFHWRPPLRGPPAFSI